MNFCHRSHISLIRVASVVLSLTFLISACNVFQQSSSKIEINAFTETIENYPQAEVVFQVKLPSPLADNEKLVLEILDEVTGVYFNPTHYEMAQQDAQDYFIRIPLTIGLKIKYRFLRKGPQSIHEYTSQNKQVRFRVLLVNGPILVQDSVAAWSDLPYTGAVGRIQGQLIDRATNVPIPNAAVYTAGMQTLSASDGTFILEGIPVWTHNVVIASLDGAYETFQQGAMIEEAATTPIVLSLQKRSKVDVVFEVKMPDGFSTNLPLRLASNLYSLGFPEAELSSGSAMAASNLPVFSKNSSNIYSLKLSLPVGTDLKYKFTFGDGFWNSELTSIGNFVSRTLLVPAKSVTTKKKIEMINSPEVGEITFTLTTPPSTPFSDQISLQLNPFGWMQPLPMIKTGENMWSFTLFSPTHLLGNIEYRFCRNDQCDLALSDPTSNGFFTGLSSAQPITVDLENWQNMDAAGDPTSVITNGGDLQPREEFITGFELISNFPTSWKGTIDQGLQVASNNGGKWAILTPTWSITSINPPTMEPVPGNDLLWNDLQDLTSRVSKANMQPVVFPIVTGSVTLDDFWTNGVKDAKWWQSVFDGYRRFILQNADLANIMDASAILIGDPGMRPAMEGGTLSDGNVVNAPIDLDEQWRQLIIDVRSKYEGPVIGVISIPNQNTTIPDWLTDVDALYVLFSPSLAETNGKSVDDLIKSYDSAMDLLVKPLAEELDKPIILGINYPSTNNALNGCISSNASCMFHESDNLENATIDLDLQSRIYNAAIIASVNRTWISGFIAREFNPIVVLHDKSSSVYGKPASDVLWFWYHFILNKPS